MYRCNTCIYRVACQGAAGARTCEGYVRDNKSNREKLAASAASREQAFVSYLNKAKRN